MQDPVFTVTSFVTITGAEDLLSTIRTGIIAAGWIVDEYDTSPVMLSETGGHELYFHSDYQGVPSVPYYSLKALDGKTADHEGLALFMNTGYDSNKRVDNQPGMLVRGRHDITDAPAVTEVFSGLWDGSGANRNPADPGMYLTNAWSGGVKSSPIPTIPSNQIALNTFASSTIDKVWMVRDVNAVGGATSITFLWYVDNMLNGFSVGHVLYDSFTPASPPTPLLISSPYDVDGWLCNQWMSRRDESTLLANPRANSIAASITDLATADHHPQAVIRNRTNGAEEFPAGTPSGVPLIDAGPVVLSVDRVLASDRNSQVNISSVVRPDQSFDTHHNDVQGSFFPDPQVTIHRETAGAQHRVGFARARMIARWPDGGALTGSFQTGLGVTDWRDDAFYLPFYYASTLGKSEGDTVTNGTRSYLVFPGNRGGPDSFAFQRRAGLAFRTL